MEINLIKQERGLQIVSGQRRVLAALSLSDEILVTDPNLGDFLLVKQPDGRIVATQDAQTMALWGLKPDRSCNGH